VTDAMTDMDADNHDHSVAKIFPRIGETTTTSDLLDMLAQSPVRADAPTLSPRVAPN
jgi:hypothetical protein